MVSLTYAGYLRLDDLLSLQRPRTPPDEPGRVRAAEHFFIVAHQCCELWLAQALLDLDAATEELATGGQEELALEYLERVIAVLRLLDDHLVVLERLPVVCFAAFRPYLESASGAQSRHLHTLDHRLGLGGERSEVAEAFTLAVHRAGHDLRDVFRDDLDSGVLHRLGAALLDLAKVYWEWKVDHLGLVLRLIGTQQGTGGTSGVDYLARRVAMPFPELRELQQLAAFGPDAALDGAERRPRGPG